MHGLDDVQLGQFEMGDLLQREEFRDNADDAAAGVQRGIGRFGFRLGLRSRLLVQESLNQPAMGGVVKLVKILVIFSLTVESAAATPGDTSAGGCLRLPSNIPTSIEIAA